MNHKFFLETIIIILIFLSSNLKAETIFFDSKNIKIEDNGNMIFATKGKAKIPESNLIIEGDKFIYNKIISELVVIDNVKYFDNIRLNAFGGRFYEPAPGRNAYFGINIEI